MALFNDPDVQSVVSRLLPGAIGASISMFFSKQGWELRLLSFATGMACSFYGTADAVRITGLSSGLAGFLLGLFGMSIAGSIFEGLRKMDVADILGDLARKWFGLAPRQDKKKEEE